MKLEWRYKHSGMYDIDEDDDDSTYIENDDDDDDDEMPELVDHYDSDSDDDDDDDDEDDDNDYEIVEPDEIHGLAQSGEEQQSDTPNTVVEQEQDPGSDQDIDDNEDENTEEPESNDTNDQPTNVEEPEEPGVTTRSGRPIRPVSRMNLFQSDRVEEHEYSNEMAMVMAMIMCQLNDRAFNNVDGYVAQFIQTYSLKAGLKKFKERGRKSAMSEMGQLHERAVFEPVHVDDLTKLEKERAMESLIFLVEKRDGRVKARTCANGSTQRTYVNRDEAASPTASTESILITATLDAKQERDVMTCDIPNAFVQTDIPIADVGERVVMKIRGALVDMLLELAPEVYTPYVTMENGQKVLYVICLKALYGMLVSSMLYYKKFRKDIEEVGYEVNPYDPCVANKKINGMQHTLLWHVDDVKASHIDEKVNDQFLEWLNIKYGELAPVTATRGKVHDYLGMKLDFQTAGVAKINMVDYAKAMVNDFPEELTSNGAYPWTEKLFQIDKDSPALKESKRELLHTFVMRGMFLCKRARQDIQPGIAFLATRVREATDQDWSKLKRLMAYLKATQDVILTLEADDEQTIYWHVDASFAVHEDYKSHTGATFSLGKGVISSICTKQKVNTRSSTEAELVGVDDVISKILWSKRFIEAQGHKVKMCVIYRDNTSSMKLEKNGRASASKRTRHFNIKYFYITDLIKRDEVTVEYCPTDEMTADYMTKPTVGQKFTKFRNRIMNMNDPDVSEVK